MEAVPGSVVISKAGRDKGYALYVVSIDDHFIYVADGRERPLEKAKKKNPKHVTPTSKSLSQAEVTGNKALKRALRNIFN